MKQIFRKIEFVQKSGEEMQHLYDKEFENQSGDVSKNTRLTSDNLICQKSLYENLVWNLEFHDDFVVIKGMTTSAVYVVFCLLFIVGFIVANLCICGLLQGAIVIPAVLLCIVAIGALPYLHLQYRKNYDAVKAKVMGFLDKP